MNPTLSLIEQRRSRRVFDHRPLSEKVRNQIISAASRAASYANMKLFSMIEVNSDEKKKKLSETCGRQPFIANAPWILIFLADMQKWYDFYHYSRVSEHCLKRKENIQKPNEADLILAVSDASSAAQNSIIAAESLNVGSVLIHHIMSQEEVHRKIFNLPDLVIPVSLVCYGYYPEDSSESVQHSLFEERLLFHETYQRLMDSEFEQTTVPLKNEYFKNGYFYQDTENIGQHYYRNKTASVSMVEMRKSVRKMIDQWKKPETLIEDSFVSDLCS